LGSRSIGRLVHALDIGLSAQLSKLESNTADGTEYDNLKDFYERRARMNRPDATTKFDSLLSKSYRILKSTLDARDEVYVSTYSVKDDAEKELQEFLALPSNQITTLDQRFSNLRLQLQSFANMKPLRVALCTKLIKRCNVCDTTLVKPEVKAQSYSLVENCTAMYVVLM
jgi:DNA-binding PucR family transcriptional regulator